MFIWREDRITGQAMSEIQSDVFEEFLKNPLNQLLFASIFWGGVLAFLIAKEIYKERQDRKIMAGKRVKVRTDPYPVLSLMHWMAVMAFGPNAVKQVVESPEF